MTNTVAQGSGQYQPVELSTQLFAQVQVRTCQNVCMASGGYSASFTNKSTHGACERQG